MTDRTNGPVRLGLIDGDGIGPEVVRAARQVVDEAVAAAGAPPIEWVPLLMGHRAIEEYGDPLPRQTLDALAGVDAWILGPHDNASYPQQHRAAPGGAIRKQFGLYANIRPARAFAGVRALAPAIDLVIVRENSEGFYADRNMFAGSGEFRATEDVAMAVGVVTRQACERIAHEAFRLAATRRKRLTIVHKANVLPMTMGLFRDVCYEIAHAYPGVEVDDEHVDATAAHLVRAAADYDVLVTENLFGDILSDLAGELSGSLGLAASLNCSATHAMAQAVHGAAPALAGHNRANPAALQLSAAMLLRWLGTRDRDGRYSGALRQAAERVERAVAATFEAGIATADLGGLASTSEFTEQVCARVHRR
ncbi:isocitrate/isopropylmalate dehydrogenase family protein [Nocardia brasiliensis]|uniref:isocitrate/isopropylmalate dehydrogenase family protein n=1 Tax=Nocardia brasiliensis TaxID=37326 RepID=UPI00189349F3|nr:isocitrate/isopropylmalate family dehydrogenase [Nocardia brasiliensis]MBF6127428.1 isocitrate/isopropylmalate dehydrogenase family protein [Nocardia brasiliensis]MBF6547263.1 isocitrate/isopropylmalate dehydrogenase family protein [Nocardia brasiliensis]